MTCATCGKAFPANELVQTPKGLLCRECRIDAGLPAPGSGKLPASPVAIAGLVAGALPFGLHMSTSSSVTIDGVTQGTYRDYLALGGGGLALVLGAVALFGALKATDQKGARLGIGAGVIALGLYQLLRGVGML